MHYFYDNIYNNDKALLELNVAMLCTADILLPGGPLKGALLLLCLCFDNSTPSFTKAHV